MNKVLLCTFIILLVIFSYFLYSYTLKKLTSSNILLSPTPLIVQPTLVQISPSITNVNNKVNIKGGIQIYRVDEKNGKFYATLNINAQSDKGTIKEMAIWTDKNQNKNWQPYQKSIQFDIGASEQVFIQFKDSIGNISETYNDSTGPLNQTGKLAE